MAVPGKVGLDDGGNSEGVIAVGFAGKRISRVVERASGERDDVHSCPGGADAQSVHSPELAKVGTGTGKDNPAGSLSNGEALVLG